MDVLFIGLSLLLGVFLVFVFIKKKSLAREVSKLRNELDESSNKLSQLESLSKYQGIADIEVEISRLLLEADRERKEVETQLELLKEDTYKKVDGLTVEAKNEAKNIRNAAQVEAGKVKQKAATAILEAEQEAKNIRLVARTDAGKVKEKAEVVMLEAREHAEHVRAQARDEAQQIAGDALEAKEKADLWSGAAKAARNTIIGYGDDYVMPSQSLLDDLAEDFSHKDAGKKLKEARLRTKTLVKRGDAAVCDYVEQNRRETAIRFVLDAYIGKVDSALSKVKHDNYGKLKQQIEDALQLVNYNGSAFRNAHITQELHAARLSELEWAVVTSELQLQEREEQKQIREQMRDEERARREYEKAIKAAEKEEKLLQKAMEKARKELGEASEEQRQKYELQLADLEEKLKDAESRNERALSMAQQTRRGHVYVISNTGSFGDDVYKVGMTRRLEPMDRVKELGDASVPFSFDVHAMIYSEDAPALEKLLHRRFEHVQVNKVNPRKEFFKTALAQIREVVDEMQTEVHWTMAAEAREYRESLAIEKTMAEGVTLKEASPEIAVH